MDTQQAMNILQSLLDIYNSEQRANDGKIQALTVALGILNGTLETQSTTLEEQYQATINQLTNDKTDLENKVVELTPPKENLEMIK